MEFRLPARVQALLLRLQGAGYEAFAVGGCVRDLLRGTAPKDWDITTSAAPQKIMAVFSDCRVLPTGLKHGTVTVLWQGEAFEVTTYRVDGSYMDHRRPCAVRFTTSLQEDLARRDFTINAMALSAEGKLYDPFGGQQDLAQGLLRTVGCALRRFNEDSLRILRCLRFSAVMGFAIEEKTAEAMVQCAPMLSAVSCERVYEEVEKLCCGPWAATVLQQYGRVLYSLSGWQQKGTKKIGWQNSALQSMSPQPALRLSVLLWEGFGTAAGEVLSTLRCAYSVKEQGKRLLYFFAALPPGTRYEAKILLAQLPEQCRAEAVEYQAAAQPQEWGRAALLCREVLAQSCCLCRSQLAITGADLLDLGVSEGRQIGQLLNQLLEAVLLEKVENTRETLLLEVEKLWKAL